MLLVNRSAPTANNRYGEPLGCSVMQDSITISLQPSERHRYTESRVLRILGHTSCRCGRRISEAMDATSNAYFCLHCQLACARLWSENRATNRGTFTYWDNFSVGGSLVPSISDFDVQPMALRIPEVIQAHGLLGIYWIGTQWVSLWPLGLLVVAHAVPANCLLEIGKQYRLGVTPVEPPSPAHFGFHGGWSLQTLSTIPHPPHVEDWPERLQAFYNLTEAETRLWAGSIANGVALLNRIYEPREASAMKTDEMLVVARLLGLSRNSSFNDGEWKKKVMDTLQGFGGAEKVMRRVTR